MAQISLTFPDGNSRSYDAGITAAEVAADISSSLGKKAISATIDGQHWDLQWPIEGDASISIHTVKDDAQSLELIRHDLAHIMARAVQEIWPDVKVTIGPVIENGWYYDFDREEPFTPEDLGQIESLFSAAYERAGRPKDMVLYLRHESEGRLHCEAIVYLSPAAADVAREIGADSCARPTSNGLGLLVGG